jgi:CRISPR/Cas system CMR-associated protein Cmr1 (group 7 of RAMP superfamily)
MDEEAYTLIRDAIDTEFKELFNVAEVTLSMLTHVRGVVARLRAGAIPASMEVNWSLASDTVRTMHQQQEHIHRLEAIVQEMHRKYTAKVRAIAQKENAVCLTVVLVPLPLPPP